jgi:hypothetical protein
MTDRDNALTRCREIIELQGTGEPPSVVAAWQGARPLSSPPIER